MEEFATLAEIEYSKKLTLVPTAYEPGVWRYCFFATGSILPFMQDTFNRENIIVINNIVIDQIEYTLFDSLEELRAYKSENNGGWVNDYNIIYIRCPHYFPLYVFYSLRYGCLVGFTNSKPTLINNLLYRSGLLSQITIEQSADALTYDRMIFNSNTVSIDNTNCQFDDVDDLFGNEFNILITKPIDGSNQKQNVLRLIERAKDERVVSAEMKIDEYITLIKEDEKPYLKFLIQYYIANITTSLEKVNFHLKDKRERLSPQVPNKQFNEIDYPKIADNLIGKDMQEVYGHCFGVPLVCLEEKSIYINGTSGEYLKQYRFRASSQITRIDRIEVKMTSGKYQDKLTGEMIETDGWTTVWRREEGAYPENWMGWKGGIHSPNDPAGDLISRLDQGEITLRWDIAKQGGKRENKINEVRMDGVFISFNNGKASPLDILKDIMLKYSFIPYDNRRYNIDEIERELAPLKNHEIGIVFDKSVLVYEAIEKLQSGCVLGFQFQMRENKFTARLDNPNRIEDGDISDKEILHLNEVEVDWNADLYGTYTDIEYGFNHSEGNGKRYIDKSKRQEIISLHRVEKVWEATTLLAGKSDAKLKSDILLEDFENFRPIIKNIQLEGEKWHNLSVYDIRYIDFRVTGEEIDKYPQNLIRLIEKVKKERAVVVREKTDEYVVMNQGKYNPEKREFAGRLRCQILRVELDTQTGITTIDVRVREKSKALQEAELW